MIASSKPGWPAQVWYRASVRSVAPWHGRTGVVVVASRGKPRNHGIDIDGTLVVVPCGNLRGGPRA
jgi:hypothetical protein